MPPRPDLGPKPLLGYTESILARVAERRSDEVFLTACEADPRAGTFAIGGELVVLKRSSNGADPLFRPDEARALAPVGEKVFLGLADDAGRFGIALDAEATKALKGRPDLVVTDLRSIAVQGLVGPEHLAPLAEAKALLAWHGRHRFCAICGEVKYFRSQPWPFPMSLMIGCHARATNSDIKVDREELEDARWFSRDETALMFVGRHPEGISIPPPIAIAHHIIRAWVEEGDGVFR